MEAPGVLTQRSTPTGWEGYRIVVRDASELRVGVEGEAPKELSLSVFPNPARTPALSFSLPRGGEVEIGVYGVAGRRLAVVAKGTFAAGTHTRRWDGRDAGGHPAAAGVYFFRLRVGGETRVVRAVLLQ